MQMSELSVLVDAGLSASQISTYQRAVNAGDAVIARRVIQTHRTKLVSNAHRLQDQLFCTDVLLRSTEDDFNAE